MIRLIGHTVFTAGHEFRLSPDSEVPACLHAFSAEDAKLEEIVKVGEGAINWENEKLRNIVGVDQYQHVCSECLAERDRKLSTCFLIRGSNS